MVLHAVAGCTSTQQGIMPQRHIWYSYVRIYFVVCKYEALRQYCTDFLSHMGFAADYVYIKSQYFDVHHPVVVFSK